jgi:hypothetical protein
MISGFGELLRAIKNRWFPAGGGGNTESALSEGNSRKTDMAEVEDAIAAFRDLISKLSKNGNEIGDMYLSAQRKAARYALLSETVVESATSGILVVDDMHEIRLANSAAKRILGCDPEIDLTGRRLASLFEDCRQLESLVAQGFRAARNSYRKEVVVSLHGGTGLLLGVSTSCVVSGRSKPDAVTIIFTTLDKDATGTAGGRAEESGQAAKAYRKGMLDAYGVVSEIYTDIEGLRTEIEKGNPDVSNLAQVAERLEFACELMMGFALSKVGPGAMTELVDLKLALRDTLEARGLSGRRIISRFGPDLPAVSTVKRVLDAGLDMLLKGCLAESADGVEIAVRRDAHNEDTAVCLTVRELSPTLPLAEVKDEPRGFLEGKALRRELGLLLLRSLPARSHSLTVRRDDGSFTFSLTFLMPKHKEVGKKSPTEGFSNGKSDSGDIG